MTHHILNSAETKPRHDMTKMLGDHQHVIHNIFGLALETPTQLAILRGNANRARVLLAITLH